MSARARDDVRLAWLIVGASATVTLAFLAVLLVWGVRQMSRWAAAQARASAERGKQPTNIFPDGGALPEARTSSDTPLPITPGPPPPDTARPLGSPARWIGSDDYPATALREGYEGRVRVTVSVDRAGSPTGCGVRVSSGHWSLDNATCAAMLNHGGFDRAPGDPRVRHWTSPVIRWVLPR